MLVLTITDTLSSDEDDMEEKNATYLEQLGKYIKKREAEINSDYGDIHESLNGTDSDEETIDDLNETALEGFTTPIDDEEADVSVDEYVVFKEVITGNIYKNI